MDLKLTENPPTEGERAAVDADLSAVEVALHLNRAAIEVERDRGHGEGVFRLRVIVEAAVENGHGGIDDQQIVERALHLPAILRGLRDRGLAGVGIADQEIEIVAVHRDDVDRHVVQPLHAAAFFGHAPCASALVAGAQAVFSEIDEGIVDGHAGRP